MSVPSTASDFLPLLRESGLVDEARLSAFLERLGPKAPAEPAPLADLMIREGLLTRFQSEQLLQGKKPAVDKKAPDGTPFIAETPVVVTTDNMQQVFDDGNANASTVLGDDRVWYQQLRGLAHAAIPAPGFSPGTCSAWRA